MLWHQLTLASEPMELTTYDCVVSLGALEMGDWPQNNERLEKTAAGYGIEISSSKSKILINRITPRPPTNIW